VTVREMNELDQFLADEIYNAVQHQTNNTARSQQQQEFFLGVSNFGHCRNYARLLMLQTPESDKRDKTAAWIGTVLGDAIEKELAILHPDWLFQQSVTFKIPSGGEVGGHPDIVVPNPQIVGDLKSKAELDSVKRYGQNQQQRFQLHCYAQALIDAGIFDPAKPIYLADIFYDRAAKGGQVEQPYVIGEPFDPSVIEQVDEWINDVKYAVIQGEEAQKDMPREWCWSFCEYASICRGQDTDVEGLIEDPEVVAAVDMHTEAAALEKQAKKLKNNAQIILNRIESGSTGTHQVRWTEVQGGHVEYYRKPYKKLSITPIKGGKK
jgi:hypothetical protein